MLNETKKLAILGSTGSIGTQTLHIVKNNPHLFKVFLLSAHSNYMLLFEQAKEFTPKHVVINTLEGYEFLKKNHVKNPIFSHHDRAFAEDWPDVRC